MAIKIEVMSPAVETFSGLAKESKKPYTINKQAGWLHNPAEPYPTKIDLMLKDASKPYAVGVYTIDLDKSLYVDRNGRLAITPVLIPATPAASGKAA